VKVEKMAKNGQMVQNSQPLSPGRARGQLGRVSKVRSASDPDSQDHQDARAGRAHYLETKK